MSRNASITMSVLALALAASGCGEVGPCEECVSDHAGTPDAGQPDDSPDDPGEPDDAGEPDDPDDPGEPDDPSAPTIEVLTTTAIDERDDRVTFTAAGVPRTFDHVGEPVALGGVGCPVIYKHAFLLRPDHGADESPANPIELRFQLDAEAGVDPGSAAFRVRVKDDDTFLTPWLPAGERNQAFTARLDRGNLPELVTSRGPFEIEMRGRDQAGREARAIRCVDLRPLAGPLHVGQAAGVMRFSLQDDDPIAPMLNGQGAWPMIRLEVKNGTRDPVFAGFSRSAISGSCSKEWQKWTVLGSISTGTLSCDDNPTLCTGPVIDSRVDHDSPVACSPGLSSSVFDLRVAVDGAAAEPCPDCAADQYRLPPGSTAVVSLVAVDVPGLQPRETSEPEESYADMDVMYRTGSIGAGTCPGASDCATMEITGKVTTRSGCTKFSQINGEVFCTERRTYKMVRALTEINATFGDLSVDVDSVSIEAGGPETAPTAYGASRVVEGYFWQTMAGSKVPDA